MASAYLYFLAFCLFLGRCMFKLCQGDTDGQVAIRSLFVVCMITESMQNRRNWVLSSGGPAWIRHRTVEDTCIWLGHWKWLSSEEHYVFRMTGAQHDSGYWGKSQAIAWTWQTAKCLRNTLECLSLFPSSLTRSPVTQAGFKYVANNDLSFSSCSELRL